VGESGEKKREIREVGGREGGREREREREASRSKRGAYKINK